MNILVCDDDTAIADAIEVYLKSEGYRVFKAFTGRQALSVLREEEIHLVIMDVMMPELDGLHATMKLRETKNIPVIMLSAKVENTDKILGLNMGADDYMTKPFHPLELLARVKSQLRRYTELGSLAVKRDSCYRSGGIVLDDERKTVTVDGEEVRLTPVQFKILLVLMSDLGRVFSMDEIYERVWEEPSFSPENTISVHIRRIREKIELNPKEPKYLKVVWGIGYKMERFE